VNPANHSNAYLIEALKAMEEGDSERAVSLLRKLARHIQDDDVMPVVSSDRAPDLALTIGNQKAWAVG
jgi:phosphoglycerate-specific signal transduction histidine kinase